MTTQQPILFTAFEPSGDALAAAVIAQIKQQQPDLPIYALGGPRMEAAGAELLETTTEHAAMLFGAVSQAMEHRRRLKQLRQWLMDHPIGTLVPVDSPAANWSICNLIRKHQRDARIVHLVLPQIWAWGSWRIRRLRRLSDHVLCILPFEPDWLAERGVTGQFVGHPLFSAQARDAGSTDQPLPTGTGPKLALLPGSRTSEINANWPTMHQVYQQLKAELPELTACIAASDEKRAALIAATSPQQQLPADLTVVTGNASAVLDWCDAALVVSGTATLHAASRRAPLVVMYNAKRVMWHLLGRWLIETRTFALPNIICKWLNRPMVVPEFVPHFGQVEPIKRELGELLTNDTARQRQHDAFAAIHACFEGQNFATTAAAALLDQR